MSANQELMDFALKSFMRVRDQEILALKESHKNELVALNKKFEDEKRKMVQEIIDLELDNKELLKKVAELTGQADAISIQRREIENWKRIVDEMKDEKESLREEVTEKDEQLRQKNDKIGCFVDQAATIANLKSQLAKKNEKIKGEKEKTVDWIVGVESSYNLRFPHCCYFLAEKAVQCSKKGQRWGSIPCINGIPIPRNTDKFPAILSKEF